MAGFVPCNSAKPCLVELGSVGGKPAVENQKPAKCKGSRTKAATPMGSRRGNLPGKLTQPRKITRNSYAGQQQQPDTAMRMQTSAAPTAQHG